MTYEGVESQAKKREDKKANTPLLTFPTDRRVDSTRVEVRGLFFPVYFCVLSTVSHTSLPVWGRVPCGLSEHVCVRVCVRSSLISPDCSVYCADGASFFPLYLFILVQRGRREGGMI